LTIGSRPISLNISRLVRTTLLIASIIWTGIRMVRTTWRRFRTCSRAGTRICRPPSSVRTPAQGRPKRPRRPGSMPSRASSPSSRFGASSAVSSDPTSGSIDRDSGRAIADEVGASVDRQRRSRRHDTRLRTITKPTPRALINHSFTLHHRTTRAPDRAVRELALARSGTTKASSDSLAEGGWGRATKITPAAKSWPRDTS
jgi:hypothetical protein